MAMPRALAVFLCLIYLQHAEVFAKLLLSDVRRKNSSLPVDSGIANVA